MLSRLLLVARDMMTSFVGDITSHSCNFTSMSLCSITHVTQLAPHKDSSSLSLPGLAHLLMDSLIHNELYQHHCVTGSILVTNRKILFRP